MHQFGLCSRYKTCVLTVLFFFLLWFFLLRILFLGIVFFCSVTLIPGIFLLLALTCILLCSPGAATLSTASRTSAKAAAATSAETSRSAGRNRSIRTGYLMRIFRRRESLSVFIHGNAVFCPASGAVHRIPVRCCSACKKFSISRIIFRNKIIAIAVNPLPTAKKSSRELPRFRT